MRLTLEKILVLKKIPLFAGVTESALSDFIELSQEVASMVGTDIIREGELWQDMYVILQGQVRVQKKGNMVREFFANQVFGEVEALDPVLSEVTVTAVDDTIMFKISSDDLYRLMNEHKSIERSLITSLCRQIRKSEAG